MSVPRRQLPSITIVGAQTEIVLVPGESVLVRSNHGASFMGRVENIESLGSNDSDVEVRVRIYFTPEDVCDEANIWLHGLRELFLTDQYHYFRAQNIERKLNVRSWANYISLGRDNVGPDDYYCHSEYSVTATGSSFRPIEDGLRVCCTCRMPLSPDIQIWHCQECGEWFHAFCIGKTDEEYIELPHLLRCSEHQWWPDDGDQPDNNDDDDDDSDSEKKSAGGEESVNKPKSSSTGTDEQPGNNDDHGDSEMKPNSNSTGTRPEDDDEGSKMKPEDVDEGSEMKPDEHDGEDSEMKPEDDGEDSEIKPEHDGEDSEMKPEDDGEDSEMKHNRSSTGTEPEDDEDSVMKPEDDDEGSEMKPKSHSTGTEPEDDEDNSEEDSDLLSTGKKRGLTTLNFLMTTLFFGFVCMCVYKR